MRRQIRQFQALPRYPLAVRTALGPFGFDFFVGNQAPGIEIDEKNPARLQATFGNDFGGIHIHHADFGSHDAKIVVGHVVARRAQPIAVQYGADIGAVGEGDGRWAVPRFHQTRVVFVEGALFGAHRVVLLPRFGNHHQHGFLQRAAGHQQELQHVVEGAGIRTIRFDDRKQLRQILAEQFARGDALASVHPILVAKQRVDLAVVAHETIGLRAIPGRERIGGKTRMHHRQVRFVVFVLQVRKKRKELMRRQHALVDDDFRGQANEEQQQAFRERRIGAQAMRGGLANQIQLAFETIPLDIRGADEQLLHRRHGDARGTADARVVRSDGHFAPPQQALTGAFDFFGDHRFAALALLGIARQENDAGAEASRRWQFDS